MNVHHEGTKTQRKALNVRLFSVSRFVSVTMMKWRGFYLLNTSRLGVFVVGGCEYGEAP